MVLANCGMRLGFGAGESGQQEGGEDGNDCDHHQQFDQCECRAWVWTLGYRFSATATGYWPCVLVSHEAPSALFDDKAIHIKNKSHGQWLCHRPPERGLSSPQQRSDDVRPGSFGSRPSVTSCCGQESPRSASAIKHPRNP